jgi:arabinofuranosyltransferase
LYCGIVGTFFTFLAHRFWFVCDDAYITFRYAQNWSLGYGLRYNLGDHLPVEGYSNFLWVALCTLLEYLGASPVLWAPFISYGCGLVLLWLVYFTLLRRFEISRPVAFLSVLTLACLPPFAVWATGGLETMPFALAMFVAFDRMILSPDRGKRVSGGLSGLAMALLRIEGIAWALLIGVGSYL